MLRVVKHHDRPPDLIELLEVDLVQVVLLLEVPVSDPRVLPPQGEHKLYSQWSKRLVLGCVIPHTHILEYSDTLG